MSNLHTVVPQANHPSTMIMSDRDKALLAADDEIPLATRAVCLGHLSRNLRETVVSAHGKYTIPKLVSVLL